MVVFVSLKSLIQRNTPVELQIIFALIFVTLGIGYIYIIINKLTYQFPGFNYLPLRWIIFAPVILAVMILALYAKDKAPRIAFFTLTYTTYFWVILSFAVITNGMQYTPFPTIDHQLLRLDQIIGLNSIVLIQWTAKHLIIKKIFESAYAFLNMEMLMVPLLLPWFYTQKHVYQWFTMMLVAFLLGSLIYYFLPTAALTSVLQSHYFLTSEKATALKFYQIHHYLSVTTGDGGMIAFPSFHVVWAILLSYSLRGKKWLFYPFAVINFIVILSTLFLGWHYLMDVIGAIILVLITVVITNKIFQRDK